jgi:predicted transcriptional regulator
VGQVDERIRADDDTLSALQQLARSQDRAVSDGVGDELSGYLAAS